MCGRFTLSEPGQIGARFGVAVQDALAPRFNVAPAQGVPVIVATAAGRELRAMRWGFRPAWMREPKRSPPINARAESLPDTRLFRAALGRGRCLIPADGFYEWATSPGGRKRPMHIRLRGGGLFAFAGLWTPDPEGRETCAIVTTGANRTMAAIHERMPVILEPEAEAAWLDPETEVPAALASLRPLPDDALEAYPVGPLVSSIRNEGPELIRPAEGDGAQPGLPLG